MVSLEDSRKKIDEIDDKLLKLFEERMKIVVDVALYKKENNLQIFQEDRENIVIEKNTNKVQDENLKKYARQFFKDLMNVSKQYQKEKIGMK